MEAGIKEHFEVLGVDNESNSNVITSIESISMDKTILVGTQSIKKFNSTHTDNVDILMGVYRLSKYESDVLVTVNAPANFSKSTFKSSFESLTLLDGSIFQ